MYALNRRVQYSRNKHPAPTTLYLIQIFFPHFPDFSSLLATQKRVRAKGDCILRREKKVRVHTSFTVPARRRYINILARERKRERKKNVLRGRSDSRDASPEHGDDDDGGWR